MPTAPHARRLLLLAFLTAVSPRALSAQPRTPTADDLFDDQALHEVRLTINPRDWSELKANFQLNLYYPSHFTWGGVTVRNVGIRSRGTGSRSGTKPGLRVDFDQYEQAQRFLGLKSLVLRNNTQDPSQLHERLSMLLFRRMGVPASRQAHARLMVNGEYAGLYTIVESVDKVFLGRHYGQNGGYLYKYDYDTDDPPHYFEYLGPDPALYSPKPFQPETHELDPDPQPIVDLMRAIKEAPAADFLGVMSNYLDLGRFMVHVAIENFLADIDGIVGNWGANNFYFYRFEGTRFSTFIPWDKSEAFKGGIEHGIWHNLHVPSWIRNRLMDRALSFVELSDVYLDALLRCADIASSPAPDPSQPPGADPEPGWLEREIVSAYAQIRAAALEDPYKPGTNEEFERSIEELRAFARARSQFVRHEVARARR